MALNNANVQYAEFEMTIGGNSAAGISDICTIKLPLNFTNVSAIQKLVGTYVPNNDYLYLFQSLPEGFAPNFMIAICDSPMNMSCQFQKSNLNIQVVKFGFFSWVQDSLNFCQGCFIDGRLGPNPGNTPMTQNKAVGYEVIIGQATIS